MLTYFIIDSIAVDFDDSFGKRLRRFLMQIVSGVVDDPVAAFAGEFLRVGGSIRGRNHAVGITIEGDGRHRDDRTCGQLLFQIVVLGREPVTQRFWYGWKM
jgi:hypothetical protein